MIARSGMSMTKNTHSEFRSNSTTHSIPPGQKKISEALKDLLGMKDFNVITTAEIARRAGVTEALIYKYFKDKKDLLYQVLADYLEYYITQTQAELRGITGALNKLRKVIWSQIDVYAKNRVFAKVLMLEVRCFSDYYKSKPYKLVKNYSNIFLEILEEGIENGEIRDDISPSFIRQVVLGAIEHVCLRDIIYKREISPNEITDDLCSFLFQGIEHRRD
jgi:TetR/AcrR family fatty acid metabolism transcriptional regulator